jgi:hypothetical protein
MAKLNRTKGQAMIYKNITHKTKDQALELFTTVWYLLFFYFILELFTIVWYLLFFYFILELFTTVWYLLFFYFKEIRKTTNTTLS